MAHWPSVEHFYPARKFDDAGFREGIRLCHTPREAKHLGRSNEFPVRADWNEEKERVMRRALGAKFDVHVDARELLLSTGAEPFLENSPDDDFWGIERAGTGLNRLGICLMGLRGELRKADSLV